MDQFLHDDVDMYLAHHDYDHEDARRPSFSLEKTNDANLTQKSKVYSDVNKNPAKGKYIEKLKKYSYNQESIDINEIQEQQGQSLLSLSKRERNRISAKQSRDRKKLYIQLMEYEQKKLQKQLQEVEKQIEETRNKINKFCASNKATVGFAQRSVLQSKLQQKLQENYTNKTQEQINIILDSISFRIGGIGRERIQKQNQCYKQIINLSLPALHRYLMWAATDSRHVFTTNTYDPAQNQQFPCPLYQGIQNSDAYGYVQQNFMFVKDNIKNRKKQLLELIQKLWETKGNVQQSLKKLEDQIIAIRDILTPVQVAKFILFASRNKYRSNLDFLDEDRQIDHQIEVQNLSKPSKKVKKQQNY